MVARKRRNFSMHVGLVAQPVGWNKRSAFHLPPQAEGGFSSALVWPRSETSVYALARGSLTALGESSVPP
jgi:hypothetical protein